MLKSLSDDILNKLTGRVFIIMGDMAPMNFEKSFFGAYEIIDTHFFEFPMHPLTWVSPRMAKNMFPCSEF